MLTYNKTIHQKEVWLGINREEEEKLVVKSK